MTDENQDVNEYHESRRRIFDTFEYRLAEARREAWEQGYEEGFQQGMQVGSIQVLQEYFGDPVTESSELYKLDPSERSELLAKLEERLQTQRANKA